MFKRLTVNCKKCNTPFITSENRLAAGRGKFCSKFCSISFTQKRHGHATNGLSPTYTTWATMLQRCKNPKNTKFYSILESLKTLEYYIKKITILQYRYWAAFAR